MNEFEKAKKDWDSIEFPIEYPTYEQRELVKSLAWKLISFYETEKKFVGCAFYLLHGVIWAHYWRAREAIESADKPKTKLKKILGKRYYPGYQLDIDHYTNHWLHAQLKSDLVYLEVFDCLKELFGYEPEENKYLTEGTTCYQVKL